MMEKAILQLESVSKFYTSGQNVVVGLNSVTLAFHTGEFVAITGESGSGKSTLSHVLSGILPYESGEMYINGRPTSHYDGTDWERYRRDNISFISQNYGILAFALTEAGAGSNAVAMSTTARKEGSEYIINGGKTFITNGEDADVITIFAVTDKEKGAKGILSASQVSSGEENNLNIWVYGEKKTLAWYQENPNYLRIL